MAVTIVEKYPQNKKSSLAIRTYCNPLADNLGLQNYGMALFDGAFHEEQLACSEINGIKRYLTGLNEYSPEIKSLPPDEQEAKIKQIRIVVAQLEKELAANIVDTEDKEFWNKVKLLRPDNFEFWDKIKIRVGNDPVFLEPDKDPYDLIKLYAIEAGGFSMIAKSLEDLKSQPKYAKFYLDKIEESASHNTEIKKLRNKALAELEKMFNKNQNKLFYVIKVLDPNSVQYKKSTPNDIMYDNADKYINGDLVERDKSKTAQKFLDACSLDMEVLKIRSLIKDATFYRFIIAKGDGFIWEVENNIMLGRTPTDVLEYLRNPLNEEILKRLMTKVEKYWNV
jgi:hypothetical protein